jgi:hypothetical protein
MPVSASNRAGTAVRLAESLPGQIFLGRTLAAPERRLSIGLSKIDAVLGGGLPRGRVSELVGPPCSGKTSCLLALLAAATRAGEVAAWVDTADAVHPQSLAQAGVDLHRLLWVRPPSVNDAVRCTELLLRGGGFAVVTLDFGLWPSLPPRRSVWPRLLRVAEQSHTALVVLAPRRVAGSFAVLSLGLQPHTVRWQPGPWSLFDGYDTGFVVLRNKMGAAGQRRNIRVRAGGGCWVSGVGSPPLPAPRHPAPDIPDVAAPHARPNSKFEIRNSRFPADSSIP